MASPAPTKIRTAETAERTHDTGFPEPLNEKRNTRLPFMPPGSAPTEIDNPAVLSDGQEQKHKLRMLGRKKHAGATEPVDDMYAGLQEEENQDDDEEKGAHGVKKVLKKLSCV